ncbi:MAG TPA: NYN domain-containing protein [Planctomycetota bacterium]|nr:NYN domain-containing protein [Planctomycetota bacterium]HRR81312.1 NYN domain-containing protein [Planctomycetota bacterium]HRT95799.1 NYN domain-containing protein [Planctomycetota bacterium]
MLILDGYNVLFAMLGGKAPNPEVLEAAQEQLVGSLIRHHSTTGEPATVVFDSSRFRGGAHSDRKESGLRILHTHPPHTADDEIRRLVEASPAPRKLRVVTSDGELMRACAARGATVVPSQVFLRESRLEAQRAAPDEAERDAKTGRPSAEEMDEFLQAFGEAGPDRRMPLGARRPRHRSR